MNLFTRLGNGWNLATKSLKTVSEHPELLLFPAFSGISLLLVLATFFGGFFAFFGFDWDAVGNSNIEAGSYLLLFAYYLINFFIITFFNVALVYCARQIFQGEKPNAMEGIRFAQSRIGTIALWSAIAATVGTMLKVVQDNFGLIGKIIIGIIGMVWSVATFFVVPVLAYEDASPMEAINRSAAIMKEKWGESIGANFSFGLFYFVGTVVIIVLAILFFFIHPLVAIFASILLFVMLYLVVSTAETIFLAAAYQHLDHRPAGRFDDSDLLDTIFVPKNK